MDGGPGWQDAEGRAPSRQMQREGRRGEPPASTRTGHVTAAWVALRRSSASQVLAPGTLLHVPQDGRAAALWGRSPRSAESRRASCGPSTSVLPLTVTNACTVTSWPGIQALLVTERATGQGSIGLRALRASCEGGGAAPPGAAQGTVVAAVALGLRGSQTGRACGGPGLLWQVGGQRPPLLHTSCGQRICWEAGASAPLLLQAR